MEEAKITYYESEEMHKIHPRVKEVMHSIKATLENKKQCDYCGMWVSDLRAHANKVHAGAYCERTWRTWATRKY